MSHINKIREISVQERKNAADLRVLRVYVDAIEAHLSEADPSKAEMRSKRALVNVFNRATATAFKRNGDRNLRHLTPGRVRMIANDIIQRKESLLADVILDVVTAKKDRTESALIAHGGAWRRNDTNGKLVAMAEKYATLYASFKDDYNPAPESAEVEAGAVPTVAE